MTRPIETVSLVTVGPIWRLTVGEILIAALLTKYQEGSHNYIKEYRYGAQEPDKGVPDEIDLFVIFNPEVLEHRISMCSSRWIEIR